MAKNNYITGKSKVFEQIIFVLSNSNKTGSSYATKQCLTATKNYNQRRLHCAC